jgi:UDP-N-acetylglucosamine 2-epimerase (non-hydrolysing)
LLFTPSEVAVEKLRHEGIEDSKIHRVGNVMIDTLVRLLPRCLSYKPDDLPARYALVTLHRPSNVDDLAWLRTLLVALGGLSQDLAIVFPVHPRTRQRISELGLHATANDRLYLMDPKPYLEFLALQQGATVVITDSGGMQEETSFLGVPCLTLRENTERPITVSRGTNLLIGRDVSRLQTEIHRILAGNTKKASPIPLWDGHAADRIAQVITATL